MNYDFSKRVALIQGASKGIGKAIAKQLAMNGAQVCILSRNQNHLDLAASEISAITDKKPLIILGDVSFSDCANQTIDEVLQKFGRIDILVNNAGGPPMGSFQEHDDETWCAAFQKNFLSVVRFSKIVSMIMQKQQWGRIINITSVLAKEPTPLMVISASLRAGVSAFTKAISKELAKDKITVNTICPAAAKTERSELLMRQLAEKESISYSDIMARAVKSIPAGRLADPDELGQLAAFLASEGAAYLTGLSISVDGGSTASYF
jgi:3-oxoacyl-[acyl-carrier protein] reductase